MEVGIMGGGDEDRKSIGSPSSDGSKMVIKLKIPKLEAVEDERSSAMGNNNNNNTNEGKRVCPECKKEFSSGKALGGHMRIHVQTANHKNPSSSKATNKLFKRSSSSSSAAYNNQGFNNGRRDEDHTKMKERKPYNNNNNYMSSVNDEGKPTCSQCGKTFPSMKSLFGHMRCHPERFWRGILPPPTTTTTTSRRDEVVDLTKFIRGWSVTDVRGRKSLKPAVDDDDDVLLEAVEDLMSLAHGGANSTAESSDVMSKIDENSPTSVNANIGKLGKAVLQEDDEIQYSDDESESYINFTKNNKKNHHHHPLLTAYKSPNKIKKRKKMKLMMELEQNTVVNGGGLVTPLPPPLTEHPAAAISECKYKCTTCNKCFASHQALGGHRSSHNKLKSTDDYDSLLMNHSGEITDKESEFAGDNATGAPAIHQCRICFKVFATGQALGGHQRCHWNGLTMEAQAAPLSQITSTGEAASQSGSGRKVLDFDLNEIPPMMMEDEAGNGNGYASSSYNSNILV